MESLKIEGNLPITFPEPVYELNKNIQIQIGNMGSFPYVCSVNFDTEPSEENYIKIIAGNTLNNTILCLIPITKTNYKVAIDMIITLSCKVFEHKDTSGHIDQSILKEIISTLETTPNILWINKPN